MQNFSQQSVNNSMLPQNIKMYFYIIRHDKLWDIYEAKKKTINKLCIFLCIVNVITK